jgi:hypothetical protein
MKFKDPYDHNAFLEFLNNFLPEDFNEKEEDIVIKKERYKEITKAKILGYSELLDLFVLEMDHNRENDPRITIATDAFKILADHWIHKALVVFKNKDSKNYRLSYLTISLDLNEKNKPIRKYSNARRYSFFLGIDAKTRTPEQQLLKKGRIKDSEDLLNRFSVEVVNKQFYLEVANFFDELVSIDNKNLMLPGVSEADLNTRKSFAVRLIGRIMFCWFLKQKKSENGQLVPDEILSSKIISDNYYHNTLEPLFFGVLNTPIDSRDIRSDLFDKVPYLNGGLFNPQSEDYYELDRGTFASKYINTLKIDDSWFKGFFELLETYNFTIDENTVFDQELSVDPEMLGRIFENLLAEINPETGSSERKRTGSFYTPRQIVEYMVGQSLIEYFKTKTKISDKKLSALLSYDQTDDTENPLENSEKQEVINAIESLKILDPACGSGAYPIGALQKIVYILQQIDPDCKMWLERKLRNVPELYKKKIIDEVKSNPFDYTRKLDVIKNSIFGVDIQPIAVDVSRLRCFLTLVVESEIDDKKQNRGIDPLPNLDFKFVCANTLISLPKSGGNNLFEDHSGITELSKIMSEYFTANRSEKEFIKTRFYSKQKELLNRMIELRATGELTLKLTLWDPFSNKANAWFDTEWMFGLDEKFDIVIANPPYIRQEEIENKEIIKENFSSVYDGRADIYTYFIKSGFNILKPQGVLIFITSNKYFVRGYGKNIRKFLANEVTIKQIINFGELPVFQASVDSAIILATNTIPVRGKNVFYFAQAKNQKDIYSIDYFFRSNSYSQKIESLSEDVWVLESPDKIKLLEKIKNNKNTLGDVFEIFGGIKTGLDEAFVINKATREKLIKLDSKSQELIKPWFKGREVKKWFADYSNFIIYIPQNKIDIDQYKAIKDHLLVFKSKLIKRATNQKWYELQQPQERFTKLFDGEKIIYSEIAKEMRAFKDNTGAYGTMKMFFIPYNPVVLAILNSKLFDWYARMTFSSLGDAWNGGRLEFKSMYMSKLPLPALEGDIQDEISNIINSIDKNSINNKLEERIEDLVFELYKITDQEKEIIKNS